jgi:hypothetical protein
MKALRIVAALVLFVFVAGCASGISGARQAVVAAMQSSVTAMDSIKKYDASYQQAIILKGLKEKGDPLWTMNELIKYRQARAKLVDAVNKVNACIATINALIPLVDKGIKKEKDLQDWVQKLAELMPKLYEAMSVFGVMPTVTPFTEADRQFVSPPDDNQPPPPPPRQGSSL